jgi:hypothetical protein
MAIKVVKNSVRDTRHPAVAGRSGTVGSAASASGTPVRRGPGGTSARSRASRRRAPAYARRDASDYRWIKWVALGVLAVVAVTLACVAAAHDRQPRVTHPNVRGWGRGSTGGNAPRSKLDGFDMKKWCQENEAENEALQARKQRRGQYNR